MKIWLDANPHKRKKNYARFVSGWIKRSIGELSAVQEPNYKRGKQEIKDMVDRARLRRKELKAIDGGNKEGHTKGNNRDPTTGDKRGKAPDEEVPDPAA